MSAILVTLLFGAAFAASVWTLVASIRPQLHRYRALFGAVPTLAEPRLAPTRITVRWSAPAHRQARAPLRAAA